ncbi:MAG: Trm112 family protein [Kofleriaceae bacterium]
MTVDWRCPKSHEPLVHFPKGESNQDDAQAFYLCPASRLRYRVDQGIPVFLVDEATAVSQAEVDRLVQRARELGLSH